jgi:hypothetical protein
VNLSGKLLTVLKPYLRARGYLPASKDTTSSMETEKLPSDPRPSATVVRAFNLASVDEGKASGVDQLLRFKAIVTI